MMRLKHIVSVSGGKDSAATLLIALSRCDKESVIPIFCDTGNEHPQTYAYLEYLERALNIAIVRLKADFTQQIASKRMFIARDQRTRRGKDGRKLRWTNKAKRRALSVLHPSGNPFLDLCLWKGRFPSRLAQFCTERLKRDMAVGYQLDMLDLGYRVLSWQGVRRDESHNRRNAKKVERVGGGLWIFRPIVEWTAENVFAYCDDFGLEPNPLYKQGMGRVGCMPCINAGKREIREIDKRFPEHLAEKAEWEVLVSKAAKRGSSTFFAAIGDSRTAYDRGNIAQKIKWSKTKHGGKAQDTQDSEDTEQCSSIYGLCE